jgi:hypothetical protein
MAILRFEANVPCRVQLKYQSGKPSEGKFGPQVMFSLMDGNIMYVPEIVSKLLLALQVRRGQPVEICKHQADGKTEWKVTRIEASQPAKAEPEPKAQTTPNPKPNGRTNGHAQPAAALLEQAPNLDGPDVESYAERSLEQALRISLMAAKKAEEYGQTIGKPIQFDKNDVRAMAATLLINGRGRAA